MLILELLLVIPLILLIWFLIWCAKQQWKFRCLNHIPTKWQFPILGHVFYFGHNQVDLLRNIHKYMRECGPIGRFWLGPKNMYICTDDPEMMEFFLSSPKFITKSNDYDLFKPWLRKGLLISTDSYWQKRRKIITPTFHFKILEQFVPVFSSGVDVLIENLRKEMGKPVTDIYPFVTAYTLDTICESAMGTSVQAQSDPNNAYVQAVRDVCSVILNRTFSPWLQIDFIFKLSKSYPIQKHALNTIHTFTQSVIEKRKRILLTKINADNNQNQQQQQNGGQIDNEGIKKKMAFLDLLLQSTVDGVPLSDEEIQEEVDTFMFEERMMEELKTIFENDPNKELTLQDLNEMKYIELVIKETLRLYPSVPIILRKLQEDIYYKGSRFPKGLILSFAISCMHRNEKWFPEPDKFIPERFLSNDMLQKNPFSYVPFSAGPRNCIGQKFAMNEIKLVLAKVLQHFKLEPVGSKYDIILAFGIILKSANGVSIKISPRN